MNFSFEELQKLNETKPIVIVNGIDGELQWDECILKGSDVYRKEKSRKREKDTWREYIKFNEKVVFDDENNYDWRHPKTFVAMNGGKYFINNIIEVLE